MGQYLPSWEARHWTATNSHSRRHRLHRQAGTHPRKQHPRRWLIVSSPKPLPLSSVFASSRRDIIHHTICIALREDPDGLAPITRHGAVSKNAVQYGHRVSGSLNKSNWNIPAKDFFWMRCDVTREIMDVVLQNASTCSKHVVTRPEQHHDRPERLQFQPQTPSPGTPIYTNHTHIDIRPSQSSSIQSSYHIGCLLDLPSAVL
jgi:hypothetical protein